MIKTLALTTAAIAGLMIVHSVTGEARAEQTPTERRAILTNTAPNSDARAERRVALVVGNSNYEAERISLPNPKNDAIDVASALQRLGFDVLTAIDTNKQEFGRKVAEFARMARNADMAMFFYAGHAMQFQGQNYLMPVDGELKDGYSVWSMVSLDDVRAALDRVSGLKVMILDACRNNPLSDRLYRSIGSGVNQRGLTRIDRTQGMIVVYATAADEVAEDGKGRNSPFTSALLTRMDEAGLEITKMLKLVGADVSAQTGGRQRPEITVQSYNDYFLNQSDRAAWEKIKDSGDPAVLRDFTKRFPSSPYYPVVWDRLARFAPPVQNTAVVPATPNPTSHDESNVTAARVMTVPPAHRPIQPAGPLSGDQAAIPRLDLMADTTPSDLPGTTEGKPNIAPRVGRADEGTIKPTPAAGTGIHKGAKRPSDVSPPGKRGGEKSKLRTGLPSIRDAGSAKAPPQEKQQNGPRPTMLGQAF